MSWTGVTNSTTKISTGYDVAWNGSLWVAVGTGTNYSIATSPDGTTWTGVTGSTSIFSTDGLGVAARRVLPYVGLPSPAKTFVIDHPVYKDKYLVHACLEGPEAGVYYRGTGEITDNTSTTIDLPAYADILAKNFTANVTQIYSKTTPVQCNYQVSEVENGSFTVYGKNGRFFWVVYGERCAIDVEPLKSETNVKGTGPYKWIS
jgi:hypothetical protein